MKSVLKVLNTFSIISGLKCNFDKKIFFIWIGSRKYNIHSIKTKWKLTWGETQFKLLGIIFDVNLNKMNDLNFEPKLKSISKCINYWKRRKLTPIGRITVVKTFLIPILTHLFISLPSPKADIIKNLNETLYRFV